MPKRQHGNDNSKQQTNTHLICHRPHLYACCTNPTRRKEKGLCDQMSCYRGHSIGGWTRILPKERLDERGVWVLIPGCPLGGEKEAFGVYLNSLSGVCDQMNRGHSIGGWETYFTAVGLGVTTRVVFGEGGSNFWGVPRFFVS